MPSTTTIAIAIEGTILQFYLNIKVHNQQSKTNFTFIPQVHLR